MEIKVVVVGELEENCYILIRNHKCLVIDPGDEYDKIKEVIQNLDVLGVLLTHRHFDHIGALSELLHDYNVPVYDFFTVKEKEYVLGPFIFSVTYNPGHSKDSIRFTFKEEKKMFVGDFIFLNSIGRTDLEGGSDIEMKNSIEQLLFEKENYVLYPGHGPKTTLEFEKVMNPYF